MSTTKFTATAKTTLGVKRYFDFEADDLADAKRFAPIAARSMYGCDAYVLSVSPA
jgi:hypothetical protein